MNEAVYTNMCNDSPKLMENDRQELVKMKAWHGRGKKSKLNLILRLGFLLGGMVQSDGAGA